MKKIDLNYLKNNWSSTPNILGFKEMFKASILLPICKIEDELFVIFEKRAAQITQGGEICFPGGKYEITDPDFAFTAIRETSEELGIPPKKISIIRQLDTLVSHSNSIIYSYLGFIDIDSIEQITIDKTEVEKVFMVPLDWFLTNEPKKYKIHLESHPHTYNKLGELVTTFPAKALGLPAIYHSSWKNGSREVYLYTYEQNAIWGFTAAILKDFIDKLKVED